MSTATAELKASGTTDASDRRWPGFSPFLESESDRLFGRDEEIANITRQFERPKSGQAAMVWLNGPSGCGKTSLINAGICPALREHIGPGFRSVHVLPEPGMAGNELIDRIAGAILKSLPSDDESQSLDFDQQMRQFSLLHRQDPAEAAEYLASSFKRHRPAGVESDDPMICLIVLDQLERLSPDETSILPDRDPTWKVHTLQPVLVFLHDLLMTGLFPCLVALRSPNIEIVKNALSDCDFPTLGHWDEIESVDLDAARRFFENAPADLSDTDHVSVEPMLLEALIDDADETALGIPFISETLRKLCASDPAADSLSTADVGWAGDGLTENFAEAAEAAVPGELDDLILGELMLSLQRKIRSGENKGETVPSKAKYFDVVTQSDGARMFVENLINNRVLSLSGVSPGSAEIEWTVPGALKEWDRARDWLKQEDKRLNTAQRFEHKREQWEKEDRTPVLLEHASQALQDARRLMAHHERRPFLSDEVLDYLERSLALDERLLGEIKTEENRAKLIKYGGIGMAVLVLVLLIWYFTK